MTRWVSRLVAGVLLGALLAACTAPSLAWWPGGSPTPTTTLTATHTATPTASPTPAAPTDLRIWVTASLGPERFPEGWRLLTRAAEGWGQRRGLQVEMRLKPDWGTAGLVEALLWARVAAPEAAPDVVLAPVAVIEAARAKMTLPPLPEPLAAEALGPAGLYPFAQAAVLEHGQAFAYPLAAEAPVLAWPSHAAEDLPTTWPQWATSPVPWTWAARDPWAWSGWALYQAAGGRVGPANEPALVQPEPLAHMLEFLVQAHWNGALRTDARTWADMDALWEAYRAEPAVGVVVWSSALSRAPEGWVWARLPGPDGPAPLLMRVYAWAVVTEDPRRQAVAQQWLQQATAAEWAGPWARAAGLWPVAPAALQRGWAPAEAEPWASWLPEAQPAAPLAARAAASQALRAAIEAVLTGSTTPLEAAQQVLQHLGAEDAWPTPTVAPTPTP